MTASLNGIIFDQVYGDNSGGPEFDTDGDGSTTQEDEFVSFTNTSAAPIDISGWQIWSDSAGMNAPDFPTDGLYHVFAQGTVLQPGDTIYVINEVSGTGRDWMQESSEGGVESGAGGQSTNMLSEGHSNPESLALLDPETGDYLIFNMDDNPSAIPTFSAFSGTQEVGVVDGHATTHDQDAGYSYQYDAATGEYVYKAVFVPCFVAGTWIETDVGARRVEDLQPGDRILTRDAGFQILRLRICRQLDFRRSPDRVSDMPVEFKPGSLGPGLPLSPLRVSPNHKMLWVDPDGTDGLIPAKAFLDQPKVRQCRSVRQVDYHHLVFDTHQIVKAHGVWSESFYLGAWSSRRMPPGALSHIHSCAPELATAPPARPGWHIRKSLQFL